MEDFPLASNEPQLTRALVNPMSQTTSDVSHSRRTGLTLLADDISTSPRERHAIMFALSVLLKMTILSYFVFGAPILFHLKTDPMS